MSLTPLHTRMISLRLSWGEAGCLVAVGRIFDLRKRGLVPLGGKLQGPGVVHDMAVRLELAYPSLRIRAIEPTMSAFPFAASAATRGESCVDRLPDVQRLVGASLREGYGATVMEQVGGPRGCFHVFTLLRLIGPTIEWAVAGLRPAGLRPASFLRDRSPVGRSGVPSQELESGAPSGHSQAPGSLSDLAACSDQSCPEPGRRGERAIEETPTPGPGVAAPGSPLFARSVIVDGMKAAGFGLVLRGMLFDLHYPPGADALPLEEEMDESFEATADVEIELPSMNIVASAGRIRRAGPALAAPGDWEAVPTAGELVGRAMFKGYTAQVQALFGEGTELQPLVHLLFMLAPAMLQCMPSLIEELNVRPRRAEGPHAAVDSCHMWRAGGPLLGRIPMADG